MEDELEALCRLHAARAELVISGDLERFIGRASMVEEFSFREEEDEEEKEEKPSGGTGEAEPAADPPVENVLNSEDGEGGRHELGYAGRAEVAADAAKRRLAVLGNCLDAFERSVPLKLKIC